MKRVVTVRKVALGLSMLTLAAPTVSLGLGLGNIKVDSVLNQPLKAEIRVLSLPANEMDGVKVQLAPRDAFARVGIERAAVLSQLQFSAKMGSNGYPVISVTSKQPVKEPFLDFLIEVEWPKGRLLREYTILLDPPVVMNQTAPISIQGPVAGQPSASTQTVRRSIGGSARRDNLTQMGQPLSAQKGPAIEMVYGGAQGGPSQGASSYTVSRGDTLGEIAQEFRPDGGATVQQTMIAFQRKNPGAFANNNVNNLKAGYVLRVPSADEVRAVSHGDAKIDLARQTAAWREAREGLAQAPHVPPVPEELEMAEAPQPQAPAQPSEDVSSVEEPLDEGLQILAAEEMAGDQVGGVGEGDADAAMQRDLALTQELIENQRQENADLRSRLAELEAMIEQQERIINLQSAQLAELRDHLVAADGAGSQESPASAMQIQSPEVEGTSDDAAMGEEMADAAPEVMVDEALEDAIIGEEMEDAEAGLLADEGLESALVGEGMLDAESGVPTEEALDEALIGEEMMEVEGEAFMEDPDALIDDQAAMSSAEMEALLAEPESVADEIPETAEDLMVSDSSAEPMVSEPPMQEVTSEASESITSEPTESPAVSPVWSSMIDDLLGNPMYLAAAGGAGALLLALLGFVVLRSRKKDSEDLLATDDVLEELDEGSLDEILSEEVETGALESVAQSEEEQVQVEADATEAMEAGVASEDVPAEDAVQAADAASEAAEDVIAEADVYIAYGLYPKAEELLNQAVDRQPECLEYRMKLLETYSGAKDIEAFERQAQHVREQDPGAEVWARVAAMGKVLSPANPLYSDSAEEVPAVQDLSTEDVGDLGPTLDAEEATELAGLASDEFVDDTEVMSQVSDATLDETLEKTVLPQGMDESDQNDDNLLEFDVEDLNLEESAVVDDVEVDQDDSTLDFDISDLDIDVPELAEADEGMDAEDGLEIDLAVEEDGSEADLVDLEDLVVDSPETTLADQEEAQELLLDGVDSEQEVSTKTAEAKDSEAAFDPVNQTLVDEVDQTLLAPEEEDSIAPDLVEEPEQPKAQGDAEVEAEGELDLAIDTMAETLVDGVDQTLVVDAEEESVLPDLVGEIEQPVEEQAEAQGADIDSEADGDLEVAIDTLAETLVADEPEETLAASADEESISPDVTAQLEEPSLDGQAEVMALDTSGAEEGEPLEDLDSVETDAAFLDEILSEDLGMEGLDEESFLEGDDEVGTKLDLARAYIDMGDQDGARSTLEEVVAEGNENQRKEAEDLLKQIA